MRLDGATRLTLILGDPIAQVKSPAGMTEAFHALGHNAMVVPAHVAPADLAGFVAAASLMQNLDGLIVTIPHKFACFGLCASTSARARALGAVNTLRRNADGSWHGDMFDGEGFVSAARARGGNPAGRRALLVGAGGAGSAIGLAVLEAGATHLAIHDPDTARRDALVARLAMAHPGCVSPGAPDPAGFGLVLNASPLGMRQADPFPVPPDALSSETFVGCVITAPAVPRFIAAARARGCPTSTGIEMYAEVQQLMLGFLLHA
jgi:shikimate dehydrogenase